MSSTAIASPAPAPAPAAAAAPTDTAADASGAAAQQRSKTALRNLKRKQNAQERKKRQAADALETNARAGVGSDTAGATAGAAASAQSAGENSAAKRRKTEHKPAAPSSSSPAAAAAAAAGPKSNAKPQSNPSTPQTQPNGAKRPAPTKTPLSGGGAMGAAGGKTRPHTASPSPGVKRTTFNGSQPRPNFPFARSSPNPAQQPHGESVQQPVGPVGLLYVLNQSLAKISDRLTACHSELTGIENELLQLKSGAKDGDDAKAKKVKAEAADAAAKGDDALAGADAGLKIKQSILDQRRKRVQANIARLSEDRALIRTQIEAAVKTM